MVATLPEKQLCRHLPKYAEKADRDAQDELFWVFRRIARRADQLKAAAVHAATSDREVWLAAQFDVLGIGE